MEERLITTPRLFSNSGTSAWNASNAIFLPVSLPQGTVSTSYNSGQLGFTFVNSASTSQAITVSLNTTPGLQPAVLEAVKQAGVVTVTALDPAAWGAKLVAPAKIRVAVVPKPDNSFAAYSVVIFTGF